jgi:tetratricopeptide (TPR) repeat protein
LDERASQTRDAQPELLAHHYFEAGLVASAVACWGKAGERALRRSAFLEAIAHLGRAIGIADRSAQDGTPVISTKARLSLQTAYAQGLLYARGSTAPETFAAFARARQLATEVEDASERNAVFFGLWSGSLVRGELALADEMARAAVRDVEARPPSGDAVNAHMMLGMTRFYQGAFSEARESTERALAVYKTQPDSGSLTFRHGTDAGAVAMMCHALMLWSVGEVDAARRAADQAMVRAVETSHVPTIGHAHHYTLMLEVMRRDADRASSHADAELSLFRERGYRGLLVHNTPYRLWTRWQLGERQEGPKPMRDAIDHIRDLGIGVALPRSLTMLAEIEMDTGEVEAALASIDAALAEAQRTGEHRYTAESHRIRGNILLRRDAADVAGAEQAFRTALEVAQQQGARSFAMRAALALADLLRASGREAEAAAVLAPALDGFRPSPELPEIEQAQTLLCALAVPSK